jgi:large subunit ribosomal protein L3
MTARRSSARKALIGHTAKCGVGPKRHFAEIRLKDASTLTAGTQVGVDSFDGVQYVDVIGTSKGKGYAGVMKRHNFGGQPASHGTERKHRSPGSIASRATTAASAVSPRRACAWPVTWDRTR